MKKECLMCKKTEEETELIPFEVLISIGETGGGYKEHFGFGAPASLTDNELDEGEVRLCLCPKCEKKVDEANLNTNKEYLMEFFKKVLETY